jgi:uncharacterized protein
MATLPFETEKLIELCRQHDVTMLGVFGSMARDEATEKSDVDLLVRFSQQKSLLALIRLEREVSALLGRDVDLVTEGALSPYLKDQVKHDLKIIYEA